MSLSYKIDVDLSIGMCNVPVMTVVISPCDTVMDARYKHILTFLTRLIQFFYDPSCGCG